MKPACGVRTPWRRPALGVDWARADRRPFRDGNLENGETVAVIQEAEVAVKPGDPVLLLVGPDGTTRIRPAPPAGEAAGERQQ